MRRKARTISMKKKRGVTLIEILIVVGIILTLTVVIWVVVGPAVKKKSYETLVRNDLHQIYVAINVYRNQYDDDLPLGLEDLKKELPTTPESPKFTDKFWPGCGGGQPSYYYTRPYDLLIEERKYTPKWPWDSKIN